MLYGHEDGDSLNLVITPGIDANDRIVIRKEKSTRTPAKDKRPRAATAELTCEKNLRVVGRTMKDVDHNDPLSLTR